MNKKKEVKLSFSFSYADFYLKSKSKVIFMRRDAELLESYGINVEAVNSLESSIEAFQSHNRDEQLLTSLMYKTRDKNQKAEEIRVLLKKLFTQINLSDSDALALYSFDDLQVAKLSDPDLIEKAGKLLMHKSLFEEIFARLDLDESNFVSLQQLVTEFGNLKVKQMEAVAVREVETQLRRIEANRIYKQLSKLCELSRARFYSTDEARYNDYLLTNSYQSIETPEPEDSGGGEELPNG